MIRSIFRRGRYFATNMDNKVFANTELDLRRVNVIGFDYDYTLVSYKSDLQKMIYDKAAKYLVDQLSYPETFKTQLNYDQDFAVRGLTFDTSKGLIVKLNQSYQVELDNVYRGRKCLDREEAKQIYGVNRHVDKDYIRTHMRGLLDLFSQSEACLLADVCQALQNDGISFSGAAIFGDVETAIINVHASGEMHRTIASDVESYIHPSPNLRGLLERWRASGKTLFVLSNSSLDFINAGMSYIMGNDWMSCFDLTLSASRKPDFYTSTTPFRKLHETNAPSTGPYKQTFRTDFRNVKELETGQAYCRGSLKDLLRMRNWDEQRVLYFGDHLYSDLVAPTKLLGWRTGGVIREIENEIDLNQNEDYAQKKKKLNNLEIKIREMQQFPGVRQDEFEEMLQRRWDIIKQTQNLVNKNFGSAFRSLTSNSKSLFGSQVEEYCDIYTARIENFLEIDPNFFFLPKQKSLPHEQLEDIDKIQQVTNNLDKISVSTKQSSKFLGPPLEFLLSPRPLHWVFKVSNLQKTVELLKVLGMRVLRHEEFETGCEATCNGPYSGYWSKTMIGFGAEDENFVLELTYNYGVDSYERGNDLVAVLLPKYDSKGKDLKQKMIEEFPDYRNRKNSDGVYSLIDDDIQLYFGEHEGVHLNVTDLVESVNYYKKLGMVPSQTHQVSGQACLTWPGYDYFTLILSQVDSIDRGGAFGRMAFSCADNDVKRVFEESGSDILYPPVTLKTEGKADVVVTILSSPDKQEICFVNDGAFQELSEETGDTIDWERHVKLNKEQKAFAALLSK